MTLDRIAPTRRPGGKAVGYQNWRSLLFLHWAAPVEAIRPLVPPELELDLWEGTAYVGVVPFLMRDVRARWWPRAWAFNFLEVNVRTYVHHAGRPGVYFFSLDANSRPAVWGARWVWGLPYSFAEMSFHRKDDEIRYESVRRRDGARHFVRYQPGEVLGPSQPGTLEHFLLERYLLFTQRGDRVRVGHVHHSPYPAQRAIVMEWRDELVEAAGLPAMNEPPLAHWAEGVDVEVFSLRASRT